MMDFDEFKTMMTEQYGESEEYWGPLSNIEVLRFETDSSGRIFSRHSGKAVYPNWSYPESFHSGEIWVCSLELNPKNGGNYFATPVQRIDSSFLYEMEKEQISEFAINIWNSNRAILEPELEKTFEPVMESRIERIVAERTESIESENADLKSCIKELKERNENNEALIANLQNIVEELKKQKSVSSTMIVGAEVAGRESVTDHLMMNTVTRIDETTLESGLFTHSRYRVYTNVNHDMLLFRPDNKGKVACINGRVNLRGLGTILPFIGECVFRHSTIGKNGELRIQLA